MSTALAVSPKPAGLDIGPVRSKGKGRAKANQKTNNFEEDDAPTDEFHSGVEDIEVSEGERKEHEKKLKKGMDAALKRSVKLPIHIYKKHAEFYKQVRDVWWTDGCSEEDKRVIDGFNDSIKNQAREINKDKDSDNTMAASDLMFQRSTIENYIKSANTCFETMDNENASKKEKQRAVDAIAVECNMVLEKLRQTNTPLQFMYPPSVIPYLAKATAKCTKFSEAIGKHMAEPSAEQKDKLEEGFTIYDRMIVAAAAKRANEVARLDEDYKKWSREMKQINLSSSQNDRAYMVPQKVLESVSQASKESTKGRGRKALQALSKSGELSKVLTTASLAGFNNWQSPTMKNAPKLDQEKMSDICKNLALTQRGPAAGNAEVEKAHADSDSRAKRAATEPPLFVEEQPEASNTATARRRRGEVDQDSDAAMEDQSDVEVEGDSDYSDSNIGPPQFNGRWTSRGIIVGVRRFGRINFRVILNVGTEDRPFYTVLMGSQLGTKQLEDNCEEYEMPELAVDPKKRKQEHIKRVCHMCVSSESHDSDRRAPRYFEVEWHQDSRNPYRKKGPSKEWLTHSQLVTVQGRRITDYVEMRCRQQHRKNWEKFSRRVEEGKHPVTREPLTKEFHRKHPWLFQHFPEVVDSDDSDDMYGSHRTGKDLRRRRRTREGYVRDGFVASDSDSGEDEKQKKRKTKSRSERPGKRSAGPGKKTHFDHSEQSSDGSDDGNEDIEAEKHQSRRTRKPDEHKSKAKKSLGVGRDRKQSVSESDESDVEVTRKPHGKHPKDLQLKRKKSEGSILKRLPFI